MPDNNIHKKLTKIQTELKAPKSQHNDFGNYKYRNLEDILEAVKPLLLKEDLNLTLSDEMVMIGDRFYVKATATLTDTEGASITKTAFAREALVKKGMDESQITGAASSYARKYCLNGLFCIDDTKDCDSHKPLTIDDQIDQCQNLDGLRVLNQSLNQTDKDKYKDKFNEKRESFK